MPWTNLPGGVQLPDGLVIPRDCAWALGMAESPPSARRVVDEFGIDVSQVDWDEVEDDPEGWSPPRRVLRAVGAEWDDYSDVNYVVFS